MLAAYERICFERHLLRPAGEPPAELVAPGHPLLESVLDLVVERHGKLLQQGAVLVDDTDPGADPRVLVYLEHAVADGRPLAHGGLHVVSRRFEFVELADAGAPRDAGVAPYLDLRPPTADELARLDTAALGVATRTDVEARALGAAIEFAVPRHLDTVRSRTVARVEKVRAAVRERLQREIDFWDSRAAQLRLESDAGKGDPANATKAARRADELAGRLGARLAELEQEMQLSALPPVVAGAALVVPAGLLASPDGGDDQAVAVHARETARVERLAVAAVLAAETSLGRAPHEMPHNNPGFDVRSLTADGRVLFAEVKGRVADAPAVTVTRDEILFGLNSPDRHVLALVEVADDDSTRVRYLRHAFAGLDSGIHFAETARTFNWTKLWAEAGPPS